MDAKFPRSTGSQECVNIMNSFFLLYIEDPTTLVNGKNLWRVCDMFSTYFWELWWVSSKNAKTTKVEMLCMFNCVISKDWEKIKHLKCTTWSSVNLHFDCSEMTQFIHVQLSKICGKTCQKTLLAEAFMGLGRNFELYFNIAAWPVFNPLVVVC